MVTQKLSLFLVQAIICCYCNTVVASELSDRYSFRVDEDNYPYTITQTGDNYTFEFDTNPGSERRRLKAALHVFQSVYNDSSISKTYSETFMKEGAMCFVFDANFYTYRACFLPNDYSPGHQGRFWGFVSRLPNAMWLITRNLLPALGVIGLFFLILRKGSL